MHDLDQSASSLRELSRASDKERRVLLGSEDFVEMLTYPSLFIYLMLLNTAV